MSDVIVFAGTTEGRMLSEYLARAGVSVHVCTATDYGGSLIEDNENVTVSSARLGEDGMLDLFRNNGAGIVVDATHPYATIISERIRKASSETGLEYVRLLRSGSSDKYENITVVPDVDSAVDFLKGTEGNILVTTGSKELSKFTEIEGYEERVFARVLSLPAVVQKCSELGFVGRNLICMQGPFSEELNYGMMKQFGIRYLVTKDSGEPGGFHEKITAAERAGVEVLLVGRPAEDSGMGYKEVISLLAERFHITQDNIRRTVYIIGAGMGYPEGMTAEAAEACKRSDLIIGPARMIELAGKGKDVLIEFRPEPAVSYIHEHPEYNTVAVVFSGDIGFYSGAKKLIEMADADWELRPICGISSVQYLCSRLGMPWQDVFLMSNHGSEENITGEIRRHGKVFSLLSKGTNVNELCRKLISYGLEDVLINVGENLGYDQQRIVTGTPADLLDKEFNDLSVILVLNPSPDTTDPIGIPDEEFIRGDVPMTKSEVRSLTVSKLKLSDDSIVYDVGAGTGSVAVEMARVAVRGKVYAAEMKKEAIELMNANKERFAVDNMIIVEGRAPDSLVPLPAPTHAFIGGSSGELQRVLSLLLEKNPSIRVVINSVTLETVSEAHRCIRELGMEELETICVSISRSKTTDMMHLMMAQNPIYMITCRGKG